MILPKEKRKPLTEKEQMTLEYIQDYMLRENIVPSMRELCDGLGCRSTCTIFNRISSLEQKGYVELGKTGESRSLKVAGIAYRKLKDY